MIVEKISLTETKARFGNNYYEHPEVLSIGYGDPNPFLQGLSQALAAHGLKLVEIDDVSDTFYVAIVNPKQPVWGTLVCWDNFIEGKK